MKSTFQFITASIGQSSLRRGVQILAFGLFAVCPMVHAISPAPDGGYPGQNTAEGTSALLHLNGGTYNTAVGWSSLGFDVTGNLNTAVGAGALLFTTSDRNTAIGAAALLSNTTGDSNTANGAFALFSNTMGYNNTAAGFSALQSNITGIDDTAAGVNALFSNTTGSGNTGIGFHALDGNTAGSSNTAVGDHALFDSNASGNTAVGSQALEKATTGNYNVAIGYQAGSGQTTGGGNIYLGLGVAGVPGENNTCYIASIFGQTSVAGTQVFINSAHQLGTVTSSKRFKDAIKPMGNASETLFLLKPVSFRYKKEIDPTGTLQWGLVAEDVEAANPDLVVRDKERKPYSVRYEAINAMLLNEFLKEHQKVRREERTIIQLTEELRATTARQQKQIEALTAGLQKVGAKLEVTKSAPRTVFNNH